ncbi:MAG: flavin reductase [Candidatus Altiarchaeota archaeon]
MKEGFTEIGVKELDENIFKLVGDDWMLVTAGTPTDYNMMTASWGGGGVLWFKNVAWCVIRPSRFTYEHLEKSQTYTLSFFPEKYKNKLTYCGTNSGRNVDKTKETGLTPFNPTEETISFEEARLIFVCQKLYYQDINPKNFQFPEIENEYNGQDYHRMYVGEILKVLKKKR